MKIEKIDFNLELRGKVLEDSLNLEKIASDVIKSVLRIFKNDTKTLGNKSSSLSFKNKIDLLHDVGEVDKFKYLHLLKFMEIRNQFVHNHECNSFEDLKRINSELTNHLQNYFGDKNQKSEKDLFNCYIKLYLTCLGTLYILDREYNWGIENDFRKYLGEKILDNLDNLIETTLQRFDIVKKEEDFNVLFNTNEKQVKLFADMIKMEFKLRQIDELKQLDTDEKCSIVFNRKIHIEKKRKK